MWPNLTSFPPLFPLLEPLKNPALIVIPEVEQIFEGGHLSLICTVTGTPPVTFKFYQQGNKDPLHTTTSNENHTSYEVPRLSKAHSGKYFCEADNHAHQVVSTELVNIEGETDGYFLLTV